MLSIYEVSNLYRGRCYYSWRGGSRKILVKLSICLVYKELITLRAGITTPLRVSTNSPLRAGTTIIASEVVAKESYLRLGYA